MRPWIIAYDFRLYPASWDFVNWLIINETVRRKTANAGPMRVRFIAGTWAGFRTDKVPRPQSAKEAIFQHVMRPMLRLIDAEEDPGPFIGPHRPPIKYLLRQLTKASRMGIPIPKWKVPDDIAAEMRDFLKGRKPVVITLRETDYWPTRNSRVDDWIAFAKTCKEDVIFVRDTAKADEPIQGFETSPRAARELLWRAALTAEAKCNLMVATGPIGLAYYMDPPWLKFGVLTPEIPEYRPGRPEWWTTKQGINVGEQFPWCTPKQRIVWEKDTLPAIEKAWAELDLKDNCNEH